MQKDLAMTKSNFDRIDLDFYPTPAPVTEALIPFLFQYPFNLSKDNTIWEPACGNGAMSEVLKKHFSSVISTDLNFYGYESSPGIDFYNVDVPFSSVIITNPPYSKDVDKFIQKGLELTKPYDGILALLLRKESDSAITRNHFFNEESPFAMKIDLLWRIVWFPDDLRQEASPRHNFSWFVWSWKHKGKAFIEYADKPNRKQRKIKDFLKGGE